MPAFDEEESTVGEISTEIFSGRPEVETTTLLSNVSKGVS